MQNLNNFTLSGNVLRVSPMKTGGAFLTLINRQDYKIDDSKLNKDEENVGEWKEVAYFIPLACFRKVTINEGDGVVISGKLTMRKDPNDEEGKRSIIALTVDHIENLTMIADSKSTKKSASAKSDSGDAKPKAKPATRKPVEDEEDDDLFN